jgi:hypothetical protein
LLHRLKCQVSGHIHPPHAAALTALRASLPFSENNTYDL